MMRTATRFLALTIAGALGAAQPASAQLFWSPPDLSTPPVTGAEPGVIGISLPNATAEEYRAALVWNLRAALNVAALQCDFEPTLLTTSNYNAMIAHHRDELAKAFGTLGNYFKRTDGIKLGQVHLDQFGTRVYSGFSTVQAQRNFCQVAGSVGRDAIFADKGKLYEVAQNRMGALRKSLLPGGEQFFGNPTYNFTADIPSLADECWNKGRLKKSCKEKWDAASRAARPNG